MGQQIVKQHVNCSETRKLIGATLPGLLHKYLNQ